MAVPIEPELLEKAIKIREPLDAGNSQQKFNLFRAQLKEQNIKADAPRASELWSGHPG